MSFGYEAHSDCSSLVITSQRSSPGPVRMGMGLAMFDERRLSRPTLTHISQQHRCVHTPAAQAFFQIWLNGSSLLACVCRGPYSGAK